MRILICVFVLGACAAAQAQGPRDAALKTCNAEAISKWSYRGTASDKDQQRDFVYRTCMTRIGQLP